MRRVRRAGRRPAGVVVPGAGRRVRGPPGHDRRGPGRRRPAPSAAGLLRRPRRRAVRLLHARHPDHGQGAARCRTQPVARTHLRGAVGQPVPLHGLPADRRSGGGGREVDGRARPHDDCRQEGGWAAAAPRRRPRQGHRPDAVRRRHHAAAHAALPVAALDGASRAHRADRHGAGGGARRRAPGADWRELSHSLRHPAGQPRRTRPVSRQGPLCRRPGGRRDRARRGHGRTGRQPDRRRVRAVADLRDAARKPGASRAAHPRLRRSRQRPQGGVTAVWRRRCRDRRRGSRVRRRVLLRGQHAPAARAARLGRGQGSGRQAGALLEHADAALPASRAGEGAGHAGRAHPGDCHAKRRRLRRQERPVQPRSGGGQGRADARSAGEDLPQSRGGVLLPPRPSSGADAVPHRRHQRRQDYRSRSADACSTAAPTAPTAWPARSTPARCRR